MRSRVLSGLLMVTACDLSLLVAASRAQQAPRPGSAAPPRYGYFSRVQTQADAPATTTGARLRWQPDQNRTLDDRGGSDASAYRGDIDPLYPYISRGRTGDKPRPYERTPVVSPPERTAPAPAVSHNYFPGLRSGQGPNRNMGGRAHCVPGRNAFLHR